MATKKTTSKVISAQTPSAINISSNQKLVLVVVAVLLALFALTVAIFSKVDNRYPNTLAFSATGSADVVPDAIKVSASVSILANSSSNALNQVSKVVDNLRAVLSSSNIHSKNIASANLTLYPEYSYQPNGGRSLLGYRASQNFEMNILDTKKAGMVIDQLVSKTGNDLQINAISSYISDPTAATQAAREDAIAKAKAKAQAYAKLIGQELGDVISINEDNSQMQPVPVPMAEESAGDTSFDMGLSKITVSLYISYELD
jgi:uncharacterized protein YggE